jgi:hypothetical protein
MQLFSNFIRLTCVVKPLYADDVTSKAPAPISADLRNPLPGKVFAGYSQRYDAIRLLNIFHALARHRLTHFSPASVKNIVPDCTKSCHPPVDSLHSAENKLDRVAMFSLTQTLKGVQQDRSLTVS